MRSIIFHLYATVLFPLSVVALVVLWDSVRMYRSANAKLLQAEKVLKPQLEAGVVQADDLEWRADLHSKRSLAKSLAQISGGILAAFVLVIVVGDSGKATNRLLRVAAPSLFEHYRHFSCDPDGLPLRQEIGMA